MLVDLPLAGSGRAMEMPGDSNGEVGRRSERPTAKGFSRRPHCAGLGPIVDISEGGLSFYPVSSGRPPCGYIDIFFGNDLFCIRRIPCRKIVFPPPECDRASDRYVGRVEFGDLAPKQRAQLRHLLRLMAEEQGKNGWPAPTALQS